MEKEEYIQLRKSARKEIISHCNGVLMKLKEQNNDLVLRINKSNKEIANLNELVLNHLYTSRDKQNALIEEIDSLKKQHT